MSSKDTCTRPWDKLCRIVSLQIYNVTIKSPSDDYPSQMVCFSRSIIRKKEDSIEYIKMFFLDQNLPEMINLNKPQMREKIV